VDLVQEAATRAELLLANAEAGSRTCFAEQAVGTNADDDNLTGTPCDVFAGLRSEDEIS
jgi:hypothetical protein